MIFAKARLKNWETLPPHWRCCKAQEASWKELQQHETQIALDSVRPALSEIVCDFCFTTIWPVGEKEVFVKDPQGSGWAVLAQFDIDEAPIATKEVKL